MGVAALATREPAVSRWDRRTEASFDPFEDNLGEGSLQRFISEALRPLLERYLRQRDGGPVFVGADQYICWNPHDRKKVVAPDLYFLPGVSPGEDFDFWRVWQTEVVPPFAFEIVSTRKGKDYVDAPARYAELGVDELIILDPRHKRRRQGGFLWQVYRGSGPRGTGISGARRFTRVEATSEDRVYSKVLGCWLLATGTGKALRVRLATGPRGDELFPTDSEAATQRADAAEAEVERLRAELGHMKQAAEPKPVKHVKEAKQGRPGGRVARAEVARASHAKRATTKKSR